MIADDVLPRGHVFIGDERGSLPARDDMHNRAHEASRRQRRWAFPLPRFTVKRAYIARARGHTRRCSPATQRARVWTLLPAAEWQPVHCDSVTHAHVHRHQTTRGIVERAPTWPTGEAFPQECSACGMCGHNAKTHARFMDMFPEIKCCYVKSWTRNEIQHACLWCHPPNLERWRRKVERPKKKHRSSPGTGNARGPVDPATLGTCTPQGSCTCPSTGTRCQNVAPCDP
mmetsp:Transcript_16696/g.51362  ORF Transcript_16696/g.51362 Transcript_16696/m.51362 type:complete len:229 (+) Transcript_16696:250-936(+)